MARKPKQICHFLTLFIGLFAANLGGSSRSVHAQTADAPHWPALQTARKVVDPIDTTAEPRKALSTRQAIDLPPQEMGLVSGGNQAPAEAQGFTSPRGAQSISGDPTPSAALPALPPRRVRSESTRQRSHSRSYDTLSTVGGSLALVLTAFLAVMWLAKRGSGGGNLVLPDGVLEVLGRAPLAGRQQLQLIRLGPKLVLLCVSPTGTETLAEITEPEQVESLMAQCRRASRSHASDLVQQVLTRHGQADRSSIFAPPLAKQSVRPGRTHSGSVSEVGHG